MVGYFPAGHLVSVHSPNPAGQASYADSLVSGQRILLFMLNLFDYVNRLSEGNSQSGRNRKLKVKTPRFVETGSFKSLQIYAQGWSLNQIYVALQHC
jgi:hypothetical protein